MEVYVRKEVQAVIYDIVNSEIFVLLVKKLDPKRFLFRWRLLKGGIENKEKEEEALRREIKEEVGLKNIKIEKKIGSYEYKALNTLHKVSTFLVRGDIKEKMKIDTKEVVGAAWLKLKEAKRLISFKEERKALEILEEEKFNAS